MAPTTPNPVSCPHCDAKIPYFGANLHIATDTVNNGWRFIPCRNSKGNLVPDCFVYTMGERTTTHWAVMAGRVTGAIVIASIAFLAVWLLIGGFIN
jgi:hypothetical protein